MDGMISLAGSPASQALLERTALILGGVIAACAAIGAFTRGSFRQNYWRRFFTMVALTVVVIGSAALGGVALAALLSLLVSLAQLELWGPREAGGPAWPRLLGGLLCALVPAAAATLGVKALALAPAVALLALACGAAAPGARRQLGWVAFGAIYLAASVGSLGALRASRGFGPLLFVIVVVQFADLGAFLVGRALGRRPLVPRISPGKTWEGLAGGAAFATLGALAFRYAVPELTPGQAAAFGLLLCVQGLWGDLFASFLKRARGLKDFGSILPGHGGVIDRFDGYFFCAPLALALFSLGASGGLLSAALAAASAALWAFCSLAGRHLASR